MAASGSSAAAPLGRHTPSRLRLTFTATVVGVLLLIQLSGAQQIDNLVPPQPSIDQPPPRQDAAVLGVAGLSAPEITNQGHDFAALSWTPREGMPIGHRIYTARWSPSFVARFAPDLTGIYTLDGETVEVCTRRDGILGEGRFAMYLHSEDGGFSSYATGRWDTRQGGYSGVLLHSNDTAQSGAVLLYAHRDGWLRLRFGHFITAAEFPHLLAQTSPRNPSLVAAVEPRTACEMLPPPPRRFPLTPPTELTGRWFSNYNESLGVCSRNGSLVVVFSGAPHRLLTPTCSSSSL